jgi:PPOX class probable F420-dependent enzyme
MRWSPVREEAPMPGYIPWHKVHLPLQCHRSIWLSTTRPDGRPHAIPVWYVWDGKSVYFITQRSTQKAKNLARQPWIVVHLGDGDDAIILEGTAEMVGDQAEQERINALYMEKYVDPHSGAKATIFNPGDDLYRVRVRHAMTWEYGTIGTRTDWTFAA